MAEKRVVVQVTSSGLKETTAEAQKLNKELDKVEKKRKVSTTGSRAADAALLSSEKQISTGLGRGTAASMTRGDSRDFARQAQGLGGLVHVYATFAANVFAVAAAFNALSRAMDFELMVKSAEIMSTRVGTSLTNVANDIYTLTDAAVSLKDAFAAGNLAANAGLTTKQISGLAKAAKGASLAMGRDMTDSLNRIFRGTVKIEPELLDELGIMVKVNDVNRDYAKSIGKSVTALTDFERRQAFVNGVLEQAEEKYSELANSQSNAFSQLQASIINLTTDIGTAINTVLGPFVQILASSPTALVLLMGSLVALLVKQAIPAIKNMSQVQLESLKNAEHVYKAQKNLLEKRISDIKEANKAELSLKQSQLAKPFEDAADKIGGKLGDSIRSLTGVASDQVTAEIDKINKKLDSTGKATETRLRKLKDLRTEFEKSGQAQTYGRQVFASAEDFDRAIQKTKDTSSAIADLKTNMAALSSAAIAHNTNMETAAGGVKGLEKATRASEKASKDFAATRHRMNAIMIAESSSLREAIGSLFKEFEYGEKGAKGTLTVFQKMRGAIGVLTASAARLISAFSIWGAVIAIGTVAIIGFLKFIGQLSDRLDKSKASIANTEEAFKSLDATLEKLGNSTSVSEMFTYTTSSIRLQIEAVESLNQAYIDLKKYSENITFTENAWESIKSVFGQSQTQDFGKLVEKQLTSNKNKAKIDLAIKSEFSGKELWKLTGGRELKDGIDAINTAAESGNFKALETIFNIINNFEAANLKKVADAMQNITSATKVVTDNAKEYITGLTKANKEYDAAINTLSEGISIFETLATADLGAFSTSMLNIINNINDASVIAYTQTQGLYQGLIDTSNLIKAKEEEIKGITDPKLKKEKTEELKDLITDKAISSLDEFISYIDTASRNLYNLGKVSATMRLQTAEINRTQRLKDFYDNIIGAPKGSEDLVRQDKLIKISVSQLRIQEEMLRTMQEQERISAETDPSIISERGEFALRMGKDALSNQKEFESWLLDRLKQGLAFRQGEKGEEVPYFENMVKSTSQALAAMRKLTANKLSGEAQAYEIQVAIKEALSGLSTESQRGIADQGRLNELTKTYNAAQDSLEKYIRSQEILSKYTMHTAFGMNNFSQRIAELNEAYITSREQAVSERDTLAREKGIKQQAVEAKLLDVKKDYSVNEQQADIITIQAVDMRLSEAEKRLANIDFDRQARDFNLRLQEYKTAEAALQSLSGEIVGMLTEQVQFDISDYTRVNEALESTRSLTGAINDQIMNNNTALLRTLRLKQEELKATRSEEETLSILTESLALRLKYQQEITASIDDYIEKYKLLRELEMKKAEETSGPNYMKEVFSLDNMTRMGEVFVTSIRDGIANLRPWTAQLAESFATVINDTIDSTLTLFQTAELTWDSFITSTRNLLSDMFKDLASNQFKKAIGGMFEGVTKKLFANKGVDLRSDQEKKADLRDKYLTDNSTALGNNSVAIDSLKTAITQLTANLNNKLINHPLLKPETPSITSQPIKPPVAETFGLPELEPLNATILGTQAEFDSTTGTIRAFGESVEQTHPALLLFKDELTSLSVIIDSISQTVEAEKAKGVYEVKPIEAEPINIPLNQEDFAPAKEGMFQFTSGIDNTAAVLKEADNQIATTTDLFRNNAMAASEILELQKNSKVLLDAYNKEHQALIQSIEKTISMFDKLQASMSSAIDKAYKVPTAPTSSPELSKAAMDAFNAKQGPVGLPEDGLADAADTFYEASNTQVKSASTAAEAAAQDKLSTTGFMNSVKEFFNVGGMFQFAIDKLLGGLMGGSGGEFNLWSTMLSVGVKALAGGFASGLASSYSSFAGSAAEGMANFDSMDFNSISAFSNQFAKGGVMSSNGPLKLAKYASGGIAKDAQMAIFGEGSMNEAFVPLPDGKSIPVSMKSPTVAAGDTNISIQVNVSSDGKQDVNVQAETASQFSKQLSASVKKTVQEELIKQYRPGGMLYGVR